ncbi:histidine N-acetyltransferase [Xenopus laevis]|uniref:Histidine N-acetyltransferase n=2 Tax=Xenopus laevis TaxID=8355 RepID=A0A1L8H372_XENLA|nr:histidine N-acetyltransferase [Xenopus laevis]XP_041443263.1 histidine N-acetyltransferase [Xenopus laevis]OCT90557.1 hypothetical protein XELAEV_18019173mg [Xenopus laevis]
MSENSVPDLQMVPATESDYNEFVTMSAGIYGGMDSRVFRYLQWLKDPLRKMFLAKSEGKVVGFLCFMLVDGGTTAVADGLRVAPWMRGCGIAKALQKFCLDNLRSNHPTVTKIRFLGTKDIAPAVLNKYHLLHSKALISVVIPNDQIEEKIKLLENRLESLGGKRPLVALSPSEVLRLFEDPCITEWLLPKGLLIQSWLPLSIQKSNLDLLFRQGIVWFYSHPFDSMSDCAISPRSSDTSEICIDTIQEASAPNPVPLTHSSSLSNPSTLSNNSCGFLSLGTPPFPVSLGDGMHRFDIDLFGTDPISAQTHVLHQLIEMQRVLPSGVNVVFCMYAEESLCPELTQFCQAITPSHALGKQHLLDIDISTLESYLSSQTCF